MSREPEIRRVTARVAPLFAALSSINLLASGIAWGRPSLKSAGPLKTNPERLLPASKLGQRRPKRISNEPR